MKVYTRVEYEWDARLRQYRVVSSDSFEYHGPIALAKGDALGVTDLVKTTVNHFENTAKLYQEDPERPLLGINTPMESSIWGKILGKDYTPTMDMYGGDSKYDYQTANAKGIDTGPAEFYHGVARAIATYFGGQAIAGAAGLGGEAAGTTVAGESGADTAVGTGVNDTLTGTSTSTPSLAESTGGVQTNGQEYLASQSTTPTVTEAGSTPTSAAPTTPSSSPIDTSGVPDTGSGASGSATTAAEQNFVNGANQAPGEGGLIQNVMQWAQKNPYLAVGTGGLGASAVKGVGDYFAGKEAIKNKTASEKELLDKKAEEEMRLAEWRRQFIQGGSYYTGKLPFAATNKPLLRPDGTPVYAPTGGLIATTMNQR